MTRLLVLLLLCLSRASSWVLLPARSHPYARSGLLHFSSRASDAEQKNVLFQQQGEELIRKALIDAGCRDEQIGIAWKSDRIVVTISGSTFLQDELAEDEEDFLDDFDEDFAEEVGEGANIVELSRAIQAALDMDDEGSVGYQLGMNYEFEVTTPGASDELSGIMFESYRGFDVIVDFIDPKTEKRKTVDGRLVERNEENTVINIKGRMKKIPNETVESVRLPKAKKEKGGR